MTPREQLYYNNWVEITDDIRDEAREEGFASGIAEGERNARLEAARRFLQMGLSVEQVAEGVGLSANEVQQLQ